MTEITCIVFDIDDTLYLERDYVRSGFRAVGEWVRRDLRIEDFAERAWRAFERGVRHSTFDLVLRDCGVTPTPERVEEMIALYRSHQPDIELTPDARDCLQGLHGVLPLMSVTDGPVPSQRAKAAALGLASWIDSIIYTAELGPGLGKPNCRAFELVQDVAGGSGAGCVYVADNPLKDFLGPKSLGWATVRVRRPESLHRGLESGEDVDVEVSDLSMWAALLAPLRAHPLRHSP